MNELENLPDGWTTAKLSDCAFFQEGPGLRKWQFGDEGIPFLNIRTFLDGAIDRSKCQFVKIEEFTNKYEHFLLDEGDIVVSSSGTLGKLAVIGKDDLPLMLNTSTIRFRSHSPDLLLQSYLKFYLQSHHFFQQIESSKTGSAILNYGPSHLKEMSIIIPPLAEQRRIVAKLDKVLSGVASCRARLDRVPTLLKRFLQSVLSAACSGRLTADWRERNPDVEAAKVLVDFQPLEEVELFEIPEKWQWVNVRHIAQIKGGKRLPSGHAYADKPTRFPYIRVVDMKDGTVATGDLRFLLPETQREISRYTISSSDVYISIAGTIGAVGIIPSELDGANLTENAAKITELQNIDNHFLYLFLSSHFGQEEITVSTIATSQPKLALFRIERLCVPLPPLEEQREIVRRVKVLWAQADGIEARYKTARAHFDRLSQAVLARAFRGELVAQDAADEPAQVLLERIRAQRETRDSGKAPGKTKRRAGSARQLKLNV